MQYTLKGTGISITNELRAYLDKKFAGFDRFVRGDAAARIDAELHFMRNEEKVFRAELMFAAPKLQKTWRAEARGETLHEAVDSAVGGLFTELTRAKDKRQHFIRRGASRVKEFIRGWGSEA